MKVSYIELLGEKHPLCFSLSATEEIVEEFGGTEQMTDAITSGDTVSQLRAVDKVLDILLRAGRRYCEAAGIEMPAKALRCRPADVMDVTDPSAVQAIFSTISADSARTITATPKNAEPTQGAP